MSVRKASLVPPIGATGVCWLRFRRDWRAAAQQQHEQPPPVVAGEISYAKRSLPAASQGGNSEQTFANCITAEPGLLDRPPQRSAQLARILPLPR